MLKDRKHLRSGPSKLRYGMSITLIRNNLKEKIENITWILYWALINQKGKEKEKKDFVSAYLASSMKS